MTTETRGSHAGLAALVFTLVVPFPMTVGVPWLITRWRFGRAYFGLEWTRGLGVVMIVVGAVLLLAAISWLAHEGVKPYPPIERLITTGPYAYTRNPMYLGVILILLGQGLLFGSLGVAIYGLCLLAVFHIFEITLDDPFIKKKIGKPYEDYLRDVPGWIPRRPRR
jgi:protein-S-isoprenylcysteine O-methyltransferase Ste14